MFDEFEEAGLELVGGHAAGLEVDVEKGAEFPGAVADEAAFAFEAMVERSVGEGGHEGDLDFVEAAVAHEGEDVVEDFGRVAIEAEDEAAVDGDSVGLDFFDGSFVGVLLAHFPIGDAFDAVKAFAARGFEADEDLLAAGIAEESEEFVVLGHGDVRFGEPTKIFVGELAKELFVMRAIDEGIVVGEFDEGFGPDFFDGVDFGEDFVDGF